MEAQLYVPRQTTKPARILDAPSAWIGIESILEDLIARSGITNGLALDLGVDWGYSTVALSNFFSTVIGIDSFVADYSGITQVVKVKNDLARYDNILLHIQDFYEWSKTTSGRYDLIHIDMHHTYELTFDSGSWAVKNAPLVLFHDTCSYNPPEVMNAMLDIAEASDMYCYNWPECNGLGILSGIEL